MVIGGLQKSSMIDYPGKISCVIFLSGCNFTCPYCHNPALVNGRLSERPSLAPEEVFTFLSVRRDFLEGVVISGGEPTLQADLPEFCADIKAMGYPVKLDTNGSRPAVLEHLIASGLVDGIAMDIKTAPSGYSPRIHPSIRPEPILASIRHIMTSGLPHEFRTTCVRPLVDEAILARICRRIQGADRYVLQQFRDAEVLDPAFFEEAPRRFTDAEIEALRRRCAPWVQECIVR